MDPRGLARDRTHPSSVNTVAFASQTAVSIDKTKTEIDTLVTAFGADKYSAGRDDEHGTVFVAFRCRDRFIRFSVPMPKPGERRFTHTETRGQKRSPSQATEAYEQECRAVWRRLLLCIRAKLESVEAGIESFDESFLAQIVTPNGETVGTWAKQQLPAMYASGRMPHTLIGLPPHTPKQDDSK